MTWSKTLSKGNSKYKWIESTNWDNKSSGSTTSAKSVQPINSSHIWTTNNDAYDNKIESLSNGRLKLLSCFVHCFFIDYM